ncbi:hypothetical protein OUHCRE8_46040 [Enterobacter asburiae]
MGSDMNDFELIGIQHHRVIFTVRQLRQQFGMARIRVTRQMLRFFI